MAEIINHEGTPSVVQSSEHIPSNGKTNAALTLGIIGTALSGVMALGGIGSLAGVFNGNSSKCGGGNNGYVTLSNEEMYLERKQNAEYNMITKEMCDNKLANFRELTEAFFESYKRDVDNSFMLYKYSRDNKDELGQKIAEVDKKVDMMAAIRPYQDALIDSKINQNALIADFNLAHRTCKMIEGQLVLPTEPVVTGYGSYHSCNCGQK